MAAVLGLCAADLNTGKPYENSAWFFLLLLIDAGLVVLCAYLCRRLKSCYIRVCFSKKQKPQSKVATLHCCGYLLF